MSSADNSPRRARPARPPIVVDALREEVPTRRPRAVDAGLTLWALALVLLASAVGLGAAHLTTIRAGLTRAAILNDPTAADSDIARSLDTTLVVAASVAAAVAVIAVVGAAGLARRRSGGRVASTFAAVTLAVGGGVFYVLASDADDTAVQTLPVIAAVTAVAGSAVLYSPDVGRWLAGTGRLLSR